MKVTKPKYINTLRAPKELRSLFGHHHELGGELCEDRAEVRAGLPGRGFAGPALLRARRTNPSRSPLRKSRGPKILRFWEPKDLKSRGGHGQVSLKLADMLGSEFVGRAVEVLGELPYCMDVRFCGLLRVITTLEFLQHHFSGSSGNPWVDFEASSSPSREKPRKNDDDDDSWLRRDLTLEFQKARDCAFDG